MEDKTYRVGGYHKFMIYDPKERKIEALSFRDRVVQHCLCDNILKPYFENRLIYDNAACREGKGTDFARDRLSGFLREHYKKHGARWNDRTPMVMGIASILWLMGVSYFLTYYRNYHFGAEHGTADWGDVRMMLKQLQDPDSMRNTIVSKNISIGFDALSNMNMLIMGGSGSGKTTGIVIPNILLGSCTNVILDIKGDLLKKYGNYLRQNGIVVRSLNLKNPLQSDRYNPFLYIQNYSDLIGLITNIQNSVTPPDAQKGDPFWQDGVGLYLQSLFEYEWLESKREGRKPTMNNILKLVNLEARKMSVRDEETEEMKEITQLQWLMDTLATERGDDYPPVRDYRKLKEGAAETVRSIIIMVNAQLRLCELPEIRRIFEDDDLDLPSLGLGVGKTKKKTALFLVMRSGDTSYNLFISMLYTCAHKAGRL